MSTQAQMHRFALAIGLLLSGCNTPDIVLDAGESPVEDEDGRPQGEDVPVVEDTPEPEPEPFVTPEDPICPEVLIDGQPTACEDIDRCEPFSDDLLRAILACCECDPVHCNPGPPCDCGDEVCDAVGGENAENCPGDCIPPIIGDAESCMSCHNGAELTDNYAGPGLSNPHPFPPAGELKCTLCHGGRGDGSGKAFSHVPPPPEIGDLRDPNQSPEGFFNRLTMAGLDRVGGRGPNDPYTHPDRPGERFTNLDYIQFINPGDLRAVGDGRGCGAQGCHGNEHGQWVLRSAIATTTGIFSSTRFSVGADNRIAEYRGLDGDSLAEAAPREIRNPGFNIDNRDIGEVGKLLRQPEKAGIAGPIRDDFTYLADLLPNYVDNTDPARPNRVKYQSPLDNLIDAQVNITCGNCHLYSAGNNDRFGDFRSSGCTSCHMEYSYDGRSRSDDPNVSRFEPANPDAIAPGERAHVFGHQIRNVAKRIGNRPIQGITDRACVGCHQGSNRTVLQFWGIRMDQNRDVATGFQYPTAPANAQDAAGHPILYPAAVGNATFNGREADQHLVIEDYDGDGRDDTPPDIHHERGMGCIDCHGSYDLHGGTRGQPKSGRMRSRQDQSVAIRCESCHGGIEEVAETEPCFPYGSDEQADCALDSVGNPLRHVTRDADGNFWLKSRMNATEHYVPQTLDTLVNNNKTHPLRLTPIYNPKASYAMGRADGNNQTGIGPIQTNIPAGNFAHTDQMECIACHASWSNNCIGCHLSTAYDANPASNLFSNITGERILLAEDVAAFVYQSPIPFYLGVGSRGKITQISPSEKVFWQYTDLEGNASAVLAFGDRLGEGKSPDIGGRSPFPALSQNQMAPHSIRGRAQADKEGPRYCVACHLNTAQLDEHGDAYQAFYEAYEQGDLAAIDTVAQADLIGPNPGNEQNNPFFVHMVVGLGSGLYFFDEQGCPVNEVDANADRAGCGDNAPADNFDVNNVVYDLDRLVENSGVPNSSSAHPRLDSGQGVPRIGASNPAMSGPLGAATLQRLADPDTALVLDAWLDANGDPGGDAELYLQ